MDLQSQIVQYLVTGLTLGSIYAMVGLGFTIIYNATGIINLAQGEFVMFGGLIMVFLTATLRIPMIPAFFITLALVTIVGIIYERVFINPLKQTSLITLIIVTVAVSIFFRGIAMFIWGKNPYSLPFFLRKAHHDRRGGDSTANILGPGALLTFRYPDESIF